MILPALFSVTFIYAANNVWERDRRFSAPPPSPQSHLRAALGDHCFHMCHLVDAPTRSWAKRGSGLPGCQNVLCICLYQSTAKTTLTTCSATWMRFSRTVSNWRAGGFMCVWCQQKTEAFLAPSYWLAFTLSLVSVVQGRSHSICWIVEFQSNVRSWHVKTYKYCCKERLHCCEGDSYIIITSCWINAYNLQCHRTVSL